MTTLFRSHSSVEFQNPNDGSWTIWPVFAIALMAGSSCDAQSITKEQFNQLSTACAPTVALNAMRAIVASESNFKIYAIGVNGPRHISHNPKSFDEAVRVAKGLIADGKSIDLGLGQINIANFEHLGLSVETVFDPCTNLKAAEAVLRDGYERARKAGADPDRAYEMALSAYNTGSFTKGFENGYVSRVLKNTGSAPVETTPPKARSWEIFAHESPAQVFK